MKEIQRRLLPSTAALTAFEAVARLGSFSAAAASLALTPGAVSKHVAALESQLDTALLIRSNKGIVLTEKGRFYAAGAAEVLEQLRRLSLETMAQNQSGSLRLAILPTFGTRWLLPRIQDFVALHPDITLNFATRIGPVDFDSDGVDAAIHVGLTEFDGLHCDPLLREVVAPVCSPDFLSSNPVKGPQDLLSLPLLELVSRPADWNRWLASAGVNGGRRERLRFEQFMNVTQACLSGFGVALMPLFLVQPEIESGRLVEATDLRIESGNVYSLLYPQKNQRNSPLQRFASWLTVQAKSFAAVEGAPGGSLSTSRHRAP